METTQNLGLEADPVTAYMWSLLDVFDGRYEEASKRLSMVSWDAFDLAHWYFLPKALLQAQIYGLMKQSQLERRYYDSARKVLEIKVGERPEDARFHSSLGLAYAGVGRKEDAIREGNLAVELLPVSKEAWEGTYRVEDLARIYVMVGEYDAAISQIEFLLSIPGEMTVPWLRADPVYKPLQEHPKVQQLVRGYSQ